MTERFDFAICGAGVSGLTLAAALIEAFPDRRVAIVDPDEARLDRTIGFWCVGDPPFAGMIERSWSRLHVDGPGGRQVLELGARRYHALRWSRLREHLRARLREHGVELRRGWVEQLHDMPDGVELVDPNGERLVARFAFDSRLDPVHLHAAPGRVLAWQRFCGLRIETDEPCFDLDRAHFMDLRPSTAEPFAFLNVLPKREDAALIYRVEIATHPRLDGLDERLDHDLHALLGTPRYRTLGRERGILPLSDQPWLRRVGASVLRIGIAGGRLKPSSGYAFTRILADNQAIVASLRTHDHPFALPRERARYRWFDGVLLDRLLRRPALGPALFEGLFRRCRTETVLDLLDERASIWQLLEIMTAMPHKAVMAGAGLRRALAWLRSPGHSALPPAPALSASALRSDRD